MNCCVILKVTLLESCTQDSPGEHFLSNAGPLGYLLVLPRKAHEISLLSGIRLT